MANAVTKLEPVAPPVDNGTSALMKIIDRAASDPNFDVAKLTQLLEVKERWEATEARKAFVAAKAAFKAEAPKIDKNKHVGFTSQRTGGSTDYNHATLDHIEELLSPVLSKHGFSYSWETAQEGGQVRVTCVLTHILGHSERVALHAGPDNSGNKNPIQAVGSTATFLSRYTLLLVTGMSTGEMDDDGKGATEMITPEQKDKLNALIKDTGTDTTKFLMHFDAPYVDSLPAARFTEAKRLLEAKKRAAK